MLFDQIARNKRRTWLLLLVFFLLLGLVGYAVGYLWLGSGYGGLILALVIGFIYAVTMIFQSTNLVMAMNGAQEVDEQTAPDLYHGHGGTDSNATCLYCQRSFNECFCDWL